MSHIDYSTERPRMVELSHLIDALVDRMESPLQDDDPELIRWLYDFFSNLIPERDHAPA